MTASSARTLKENLPLFAILVSTMVAVGLIGSYGVSALPSEHFGAKFSIFVFAGLLGLTMNIWYSFNGHEWASADNQRFVALIIPSAVLTITWVISSNLALSLGMIGALSIVRFRNPVKSPFELTTFFVYIVIGVASGVDVKYAAMIWGFAMISPFIVRMSNLLTEMRYKKSGKADARYIAHFKIRGQVEIVLTALEDYNETILSIGQHDVADDAVQLVMLIEGVNLYTEVKSVIEQCASIISEDLQSSF